ncbi:hypothetical protein CPB83DRAFT_882590 [Crepidotus variabilis]|uniref:F-box domain-containing protein n=1 Tax=Crepidotus variabilis TaxID=179855 RepID=A0A9P6EJT0_9AGAR|nr:hypothetical protein CPB83DRAFT_882590 [Crepidotus variabilis]
MEPPLTRLSDDVLIYIYSFLEPPNILRASSASKRLREIGNQRIVWANACQNYLISCGLPSPPEPLHLLSTLSLRQRTLSAYSLAKRWRSGIHSPHRRSNLPNLSGSAISDIQILPSLNDDSLRLLTISKNVWLEMSVWEVPHQREYPAKLMGRWSPRGALYTGVTVNTDPSSSATIAISIYLDGQFFVKIMSLLAAGRVEDLFLVLHELPFASELKPVLLQGDIVALADTTHETILWDWKRGTFATLHDGPQNTSVPPYNMCHQVLFAHESVFVVRARSIHLFRYPELSSTTQRGFDDTGPNREPQLPIASFSFGWLDGVKAAICPRLDPRGLNRNLPKQSWSGISILIRGENDDPWAENAHNLELYSLEPNAEYISHTDKSDSEALQIASHESASTQPLTDGVPQSQQEDATITNCPYIFPPRPSYHLPALRGTLLCRKLAFGTFGTAVWIEPREKLNMGLVTGLVEIMNGLSQVDAIASSSFRWQDEDRIRRESCLKIVAFPGSLSSRHTTRRGLRAESPFVEDAEEGWGLSQDKSTAVISSTLLVDDQNDWTALDYDEVTGRVVLGTGSGDVLVLDI